MAFKDNWYKILELELEPPEHRLEVIAARINSKKDFWTQNINDSANGALYGILLGKVPDIERDMRDADTRKAMAKEALEEKYGTLDRIIEQASGNGMRDYIERRAVQGIAEKQGFSLDLVERRIVAKGLKIKEGVKKPGDKELEREFENYYPSVEPGGAGYFKINIAPKLKATGLRTLYELEGILLKGERAQTVAAGTLHERAEKIYKEKFRSRQDAVVAEAYLAAECKRVFVNEDRKAEYDEYLNYLRNREVIDSVISGLEIDLKPVPEGRAKEYIGQLLAITVNNQEKARNLFFAICMVRSFEYYPTEEEVLEPTKVIWCGYCGYLNELSKDASNCVNCGESLWRSCPVCRKRSFASANFCGGCGFDFNSTAKAKAALDDAVRSLSELDLEGAAKNIKLVKSIYPDYGDIRAIEHKYKEINAAVGPRLQSIVRDIENKRFFAAKEKFTAVRQKYPGDFYSGRQEFIDGQIAIAEKAFALAKESNEKSEVLARLREALDTCFDIPGVEELLVEHGLTKAEFLLAGALPKNLSANKINQEAVVKMELPGLGENSIVILYRYDHYPLGIDDHGAVRREFSIVDLKKDGILSLEPAQERSYYITAYLKFFVDGKEFYSAPASCILELGIKTTITYKISYKGVFSKSLQIEFFSDKQIDSLPSIGIYYKIGNAPVFKESAKFLTAISGVRGGGGFVYKLVPPSPLAKGTYIKPFLDPDNERFQLQLSQDSSHQIS